MAESIFALPVSLEQIAALVKRMSPADQRRLLQLVPELCQEAMQALSRTVDDAHATVKHLQAEVTRALNGQHLLPNEPFLGDLTLDEYLTLPESERARLWEEWASVDLQTLEEAEVKPDAVSVR